MEASVKHQNHFHSQTSLLATPRVRIIRHSVRHWCVRLVTLSVGICESFSFRFANSMSNAKL
jgi:hypothetical protein